MEQWIPAKLTGEGCHSKFTSVMTIALHFLHISDLHFRTGEEGAFDPHGDVRTAAIADVRDFCKSQQLDGIFITGDIAYSGKAAEYGIARTWLDDLMSASGCDREHLRCVPGNHDIDRDTYDEDKILRDIIDTLRMSNPSEASKHLSEYAQRNGEQLLSPLRSYNEFAREFSSDVSSARLPNVLKCYELNDLSTLQVCGLNSAILCTSKDDTNEGRLILGSFQLGWTPSDGTVWMTLCHQCLMYSQILTS